jgi:hypothetical protein
MFAEALEVRISFGEKNANANAHPRDYYLDQSLLSPFSSLLMYKKTKKGEVVFVFEVFMLAFSATRLLVELQLWRLQR